MISFEIFPIIGKIKKHSIYNFERLYYGLNKLVVYNPVFFSVTFSSRYDFKQSIKINIFIKSIGLKPLPHFPCNIEKKNIDKYINILINNRIFSIFPLRGKKNKLFKYSINLMEYLGKYKMDFFTSGYPEVHPEENKYLKGILILKKKSLLSLGIFTQCFIGLDPYYLFIKKVIELGYMPKIYLGIISVINIRLLKEYSKLCSFLLPNAFIKALGNKKDFFKYYYFFLKMIIKFYKPHCLHFYTMNKFSVTVKIINFINDKLY
ncbi:methylenetetrahydrofolate reductase [Candidatus Vidania fulgoroideorum]